MTPAFIDRQVSEKHRGSPRAKAIHNEIAGRAGESTQAFNPPKLAHARNCTHLTGIEPVLTPIAGTGKNVDSLS